MEPTDLQHLVDKLGQLPPATPRTDLPEPPTALETVLSLMQGEDCGALADAGLTSYAPHRLDRLATAAKHESHNCLDRIRCLLDLLNATLPQPHPYPHTLLIAACRHLTALLTDYERWQALADNAAYYRDHPQVANRIAILRG